MIGYEWMNVYKKNSGNFAILHGSFVAHYLIARKSAFFLALGLGMQMYAPFWTHPVA